jgi:hypothetical protein
MNAYEIADRLDEYCGSRGFGEIKISDATTMLRQQADRIAELESKLKRCDPICKPSVCDCIKPKELSDEEIDILLKETKDWYEFAKAIIKASRGKE